MSPKPASDLPRPPYAIVGLGLLGGSMAKAARTRLGVDIVAVEVDEGTRNAALHDGNAQQALATAGPQLSQCGLVVVAVPFGALASVLASIAPHLAADALLTDLVGVKAPVAELVARLAPNASYIGSHPMAGGTQSGYQHSRADLFEGATIAVCPPSLSSPNLAPLQQLWQRLGGTPFLLSPSDHDRVVAATSHLPYTAALALVRVAQRHGSEQLAGRGFADATRRADFAPEMMAKVVAENPFMPQTLREAAEELLRLAELIESSKDAFVGEAEEARRIKRGEVASR